MHSEIFRSLSEALARHLPHLRTALVRTEGGTVVARVDADRAGATPVVLSFEAPPEPKPEPLPHHDPNRWKYVGDPPGTVLVDRSGQVPTRDGWLNLPISYAGDHYAGAPTGTTPHWVISKVDGERLTTLADLPAVIRHLREGGF
jgi:hypothetical protein